MIGYIASGDKIAPRLASKHRFSVVHARADMLRLRLQALLKWQAPRQHLRFRTCCRTSGHDEPPCNSHWQHDLFQCPLANEISTPRCRDGTLQATPGDHMLYRTAIFSLQTQGKTLPHTPTIAYDADHEVCKGTCQNTQESSSFICAISMADMILLFFLAQAYLTRSTDSSSTCCKHADWHRSATRRPSLWAAGDRQDYACKGCGAPHDGGVHPGRRLRVCAEVPR